MKPSIIHQLGSAANLARFDWMHCLAGGFYALQSRISYEIYLEPFRYALSFGLVLMAFAILSKIRLALCVFLPHNVSHTNLCGFVCPT